MRSLGCNPAEYIRKRRVHHAKNLLEKTNMRVSEIAFMVGFSDYTYFSRIFKQHTGISAREYRLRQEAERFRGVKE